MTGKRPSTTRRGYGETWRRYRRWFLMLHPLCAHCGWPTTYSGDWCGMWEQTSDATRQAEYEARMDDVDGDTE